MGNTIKCSFNKYWTTDLPVRWFPASWTLRERKQREKFKTVIHDIPEDMTMATLWMDCKPCEFLMKCGASTFKIIQTSKGWRKLVAYFENWETTLRALDMPQFFVPDGKELKWCQHFNPTLKKAQRKLKAKNTPNTKKSGGEIPEYSEEGKEILKEKGNNKDNKAVLAEILTLLQKLV
ncbi:hypothetical protein RhiirC2_790784 [Rhizophagus irregularis]|uniref:Uncharacterized protein n=1 Tax=Rhizophagus irregularis TaxID=588596 RepID=A0A2N1MKI6_9GLOM|nr:hypothetical protein RhiirC2_790784 [Rhizophagus irregularis]